MHLGLVEFPVIPKANVNIIQQIIAEGLKNVLDQNLTQPHKYPT
jgi:hypothetical protein